MWSYCIVTAGTYNLSYFIFKENLQQKFCTMGLSRCSLNFPVTVQGLGTVLQQVSFQEGWLHLTQFMVTLKVVKIKSSVLHNENPSLSLLRYQFAYFGQIIIMWSCGRVLCARLHQLWIMVTFHWYRKPIHNEQNGFDFILFLYLMTSISYDGLDWPAKENAKPCYYKWSKVNFQNEGCLCYSFVLHLLL